MPYPEIDRLKQLQNQHQIRVDADSFSAETPFPVQLHIGSDSWEIYIEDEYGDFDLNSQLVCIFLTLRALEEYNDAPDFLKWCLHNGLDSRDVKWLNHYRDLGRHYAEIASKLGVIDSFISSLDYQLRAGAFAELVNT